MDFTLEIKLGDDAMQTGTDLARALRQTARRIEEQIGEEKAYDQLGALAIFDLYGNTVGRAFLSQSVAR